MTSYITLLNKIESFASNHITIKKFGADFLEQLGNFATKDEKYPLLYVVPIDNVLSQNQNQFIIDVYCLDYIVQDRSNINTIISDCNLILKDLHRYFLDGRDYDIEVVSDPNILPINNYLLDYVAGGVMRLYVDVDVHSICDIPFKNPVVY